jgi:hypothetical protein
VKVRISVPTDTQLSYLDVAAFLHHVNNVFEIIGFVHHRNYILFANVNPYQILRAPERLEALILLASHKQKQRKTDYF